MSDDLHRLSKALTTTASALINDPLLSNSSYQKIMSNAINPVPLKNDYFKNRYMTSVNAFKLLTHIPDELLNDVPDDTSSFSLFQGFKASINDDHIGLTKDDINESSSDTLQSYKSSITHQLDSLEVRKSLTTNEIMEIDNKIMHLQSLRSNVFNKLAKLEQDEIQLECQLQEINDRLETQEDHEPLLSKSIYGKLQTNPPLFKHKQRSRKSTPTLQQYYEPGSLISSLQAHDDSINCFDFDLPFGTLVSASLDNTVKVWDMSSSSFNGELKGHNAPVNCLQLQDSLLITGSLDASLKLWDISNMSMIHSFESHIEEITSLSFHNYNLISGSQDRTIRQWDMTTGCCLQTLDVLWASSSTDRSTPFIGALQTYDAALATGTSDGMVRLWDLRSGEVVRSLVGHTGPVTCLQFDDKHLATGSQDRSIRIWDLRTGGIHDAFAYESPITSLQFDSKRIVSSNKECTVKIYDRLEEKHSSCGESDSIINHVRYKEGYLVEGRADGKIGMWAI